MKRVTHCVLSLVILALLLAGSLALAQDDVPPAGQLEDLLLFTNYPSQVIGVGETLTLDLNLHTDTEPQIVDLSLANLPEDWSASFRGSGRIVDSVFVQPDSEASVDLRLETPANIEPGTYSFNVVARSEVHEFELPVNLTVEEQAPASLALEADLPSVRGRPNTTFRYNVTLRNEGDTDLTANLRAIAPPFFNVVFKSGTQEVTSIPVSANGSERLSVEVSALVNTIPADTYPVTVEAQSEDLNAAIELMAEVVGQHSLTLTTVGERLSGDAEVGKETPVNLVIINTGTAAANKVTLRASQPSGWAVSFSPEEIDTIEPGQQVEVTANVRPADNALAGDYMVTLHAQPEGGSTESVEYRVTVRTSTLWGVAGIGLIALAVGVVGFAVQRFGRR